MGVREKESENSFDIYEAPAMSVSLLHASTNFLLSTYSVPGAVLGAGALKHNRATLWSPGAH